MRRLFTFPRRKRRTIFPIFLFPSSSMYFCLYSSLVYTLRFTGPRCLAFLSLSSILFVFFPSFFAFSSFFSAASTKTNDRSLELRHSRCPGCTPSSSHERKETRKDLPGSSGAFRAQPGSLTYLSFISLFCRPLVREGGGLPHCVLQSPRCTYTSRGDSYALSSSLCSLLLLFFSGTSKTLPPGLSSRMQTRTHIDTRTHICTHMSIVIYVYIYLYTYISSVWLLYPCAGSP